MTDLTDEQLHRLHDLFSGGVPGSASEHVVALIAELRRRRAEGAELGHWYCVVPEHGDAAIKRGPYLRAESAGAVRAEMERDDSVAEWNIRVMRLVDVAAWHEQRQERA